MRIVLAVILTVIISLWGAGCKGDAEYISFHDEMLKKAELSEDTIQWIERYNELTEEEQLSISYIPGELHSILFGDAAYGTEEAAEAGS